MKNSIKVLPININPIIKTYPYNGFYLGVLEASGYDISDIVINDFFNIFYFKDKKGCHIDFLGSGNVEKNRFIRKYDIDTKHVSEKLIKEKINNNYYIMVNINEKFLDVDTVYRNEDFYHDWFIYGYNDEKQVFLCCGFINKKEGIVYGTIEVPYNNLILSIKKVPNSFNRSRPNNLKNHSFTINELWIEPTKTKKQLIQLIKDFYFPKRYVVNYKFQRILLFNNSKGLKQYLNAFKKRYLNKDNKVNKIFLQDLSTFYEHKKIIELIFERIINDIQIINAQNELVEVAYCNLLLAMKCNIKYELNIIQQIYNNMNEIEKKQLNIINQIFKNC